MKNVFIAPKIRVGFQKRSDTFTGQLAYIIYYDEKGKIRKENSWQSWRDKEIDPQEYENTPMEGFTINKDIKRYGGEWHSKTRTMIRVHDPRGFEFEVTTENLIGILMHTDCLRRGLIGQFVYAWLGTKLVLLPTNSEEYQAATKYTSGLAKKVKAKELVAGVSYKTKREGEVIFMGKLNWYEYRGKSKYDRKEGLRQENKEWVFTNDNGDSFFTKPSISFLSEANSDTPVSNYAELMEKFNAKSYANKIVKYEFRPVTFDSNTVEDTYYNRPQLCRKSYFMEHGTSGIFYEVHVETVTSKIGDDWKKQKVDGYDFSVNYYGTTTGIQNGDGKLIQLPLVRDNSDRYSYYNYQRRKFDLAYMQSQKFYDLYLVFENGKEKKSTSVYELTGELY